MAFVALLLDQHQSGRRDHSPTLWTIAAFESFLRQVHRSGPADAGHMTKREAGQVE